MFKYHVAELFHYATGYSDERGFVKWRSELLPMRCNPLTVTGPVPAFSLMVTGAFSSNSPRLTWGGEGRSWDTPLIIYAWHIHLHVERLRCAVPWADSSCGGGRWALRLSSPGGSWPSPPPRYSPPWRPLPGKPEENHSSWIRHPHCHHIVKWPYQKLWFHILWCLIHIPCCNCTYCSEFKEVLQVLLLISLESVERNLGGQLAAWKTKPRTVFSISCETSHFLLQKQTHAGWFLKKNTEAHHRGDPRVRHLSRADKLLKSSLLNRKLSSLDWPASPTSEVSSSLKDILPKNYILWSRKHFMAKWTPARRITSASRAMSVPETSSLCASGSLMFALSPADVLDQHTILWAVPQSVHLKQLTWKQQ